MLLSLTSRLIEGVAEPATAPGAPGAPGKALTQAATQIPVIARASAAVAMSMPPSGPAGSQQSLSRVPSGSQRSSVSRIPVRAPPASDIMPALMADVDDDGGMPPAASQEMFSRAARGAARGHSSAPPTSSISVNGTSFPHSLYSTFTLSHIHSNPGIYIKVALGVLRLALHVYFTVASAKGFFLAHHIIIYI